MTSSAHCQVAGFGTVMSVVRSIRLDQKVATSKSHQLMKDREAGNLLLGKG